ncbi:MAG: alkaline phosphatase family protein [Leptospiraceae bacterium]|nr:alkaline phosphatase family protein [Leptospiraceae bacterium]MDW7975095.1 alkaline phosphatase D family protein [Leptospiraceae bacterium]
MKNYFFVAALIFLPFVLLAQEVRIGFGSCFDQNRSYEIWDTLQKENFDYFIFLGDNVYTDNEQQFETAYQKLFQNQAFRSFFEKTNILSIWDDHDFGKNDAGKEFDQKTYTKQLFLDYWYKQKQPSLYQELLKREGLYHSFLINQKGLKVLVILLDTRWFRDPLKRKDPLVIHYLPHEDIQKTLLGDTQWNWLEKELRRKADFYIIASSIQVIPEEHRFEKWHNFPHEKQKLLQIIQKLKIKNLIFISGDRHFAEISKKDILTNGKPFSLYEITASSLNQELPKSFQQEVLQEKNQYRLFEAYLKPNYGFLIIQKKQKSLSIQGGIKDENSKIIKKIDIQA